MEGRFIPIAICVILPISVVLIYYLYKYMSKREHLHVLNNAIDKGVQITPDLFLETREVKKVKKENPMVLFNWGIILIMGGLGLFLMLYLLCQVDSFAFASIGFMPMLIGLGLIISFYLGRYYKRKDKLSE
ncbi:MAG: DUF6249 domain-containing protein [Bacteroidales bacterium]|jgi:hypothetical protein